MSKIWAIAWNYVVLSLRTPITLIMAFVMPVIFTAVMGLAFNDGGEEGDLRTPVLVVDEDGGGVAAEVRALLDSSEVVRLYDTDGNAALPATATEAIDNLGSYGFVLALPAGFSSQIMAGEAVVTPFYADQPNQQETEAVKLEVQRVLDDATSIIRLAHNVTAQAAQLQPFASTTDEQAFFADVLADARASMADPSVRVNRSVALAAATVDEPASTREIPGGANQSSPGNLVMFGLITLLSSAIVLVNERTLGTLRRLVVSPVSRVTLLAGKTLGPLLVGVIQMTVLILVGQFVFGVAWGRNPLALAIMVLAFDLAAVSLGIFLSTIVRTQDQAVGIMVGAANVMAALGGAWWPIDIVPQGMQTLGYFFPTAWAMRGFQDIILRGVGVSSVLLPAVVLVGFAVVFFALGIWRFRYE